MNIKLNQLTILPLLAFLACITLFACVKTEFDEPPVTGGTGGGGTGGNPTTLVANKKIKDLKTLHVSANGGFDLINEDAIIEGTVIMDDKSGNYYKTIVIQDETGGIEVKFFDGYLYNSYPLGMKLTIKTKGLTLTDYKGLTQLAGGTFVDAGVTKAAGITQGQAIEHVFTGAVAPLTPRVVSINSLNKDMVSTLVQFDAVEFITGDLGKTYADAVLKKSINLYIADCTTDELTVRTSGYADFAGIVVPDKNGKITGVLGIFNNTYQLALRNTDDVNFTGARCSGGGNPGGGGTGGTGATVQTIDETFASITNNVDAALPDWTNIATAGTRKWRGATFQSESYVQATAYNSNLADMTTWMISPKIDLTTAKSLQFESAVSFYKHDGLTVWVSNNFNGSDPTAATWTQLDGDLAGALSANYAWIPSGSITLPIYASGVGHIAFKYEGNTSTNTSTYRIDNVKVQ
jgi:hypothetical protein